METIKKAISFKIDEDTWDEFKMGLEVNEQSIADWITHQITLEIIKNRPRVREYRQRRQEWKRRYMAGEDV